MALTQPEAVTARQVDANSAQNAADKAGLDAVENARDNVAAQDVVATEEIVQRGNLALVGPSLKSKKSAPARAEADLGVSLGRSCGPSVRQIAVAVESTRTRLRGPY